MKPPSTMASEDQFSEIWKSLNPEQKAGYLVWPSLASTEISALEQELLERYSPWGVSLFSRNLKNLAAGRRLCSEIRRVTQKHRPAELPQGFIAIDEEGGRVSRLPSPFPKLEPAAAFADRQNFELESQSLLQAAVAKALGINMIFAPVCDLLLEPCNKVIGDRSFGSNPEVVYEKARVVYDALLSCGICPIIKHFPGHGGTKEDTHIVSAHEKRDLTHLLNHELAVFKSFINAGPEKTPHAVMTCHVVFDAIDPHWPVTLSPLALEDLLRKKMGFDGLIMSDDLRMNAISNCYNVNKDQEVAIGSDELSKIESMNTAAVEAQANGTSVSPENYLVQAVFRALESGCDVVLACRGIEREAVCLAAVSKRIQSEVDFDALCFAKALRVHSLAQKLNFASFVS